MMKRLRRKLPLIPRMSYRSLSSHPTAVQCSFFKLKYCDNYRQSVLTDGTYSGIFQVIRVTVTFYSVIYKAAPTMCE